MQIQTQITETVEQVQVIKEIKKQKATVTLDVDQDFVNVINFIGLLTLSDVKDAGGQSSHFNSLEKLWLCVHADKELTNVLSFDNVMKFTLKPQEQ